MQVNKKKHELHSSDVSRTHIEIEFYHKKIFDFTEEGERGGGMKGCVCVCGGGGSGLKIISW